MSKQRFIIGIAIVVSLTGLYIFKSAALIALGCTTAVTLAILGIAPNLHVETAVVKSMKPIQQSS